MKKKPTILAASILAPALLALVAAIAHAQWQPASSNPLVSPWTQLTRVDGDLGGFTFNTSARNATESLCDQGTRFIVRTDHPNYFAVVATAITAFQRGLPVLVYLDPNERPSCARGVHSHQGQPAMTATRLCALCALSCLWSACSGSQGSAWLGEDGSPGASSAALIGQPTEDERWFLSFLPVLLEDPGPLLPAPHPPPPPPPLAGQDPTALVGFAMVDDLGQDGTTGGLGGPTVIARTAAEFVDMVARPEPLVVKIDGTLQLPPPFVRVASDKTIEGVGSRSGIRGGLFIGLDNSPEPVPRPTRIHNVIVRNLTITECPLEVACTTLRDAT